MHKLLRGSVEDDPAFVQHQETCARLDPAVIVLGNQFHVVRLLVEPVSRQCERILQTMRDEQRRCVRNVALLHHELDDRR